MAGPAGRMYLADGLVMSACNPSETINPSSAACAEQRLQSDENEK